MERARSDGGDVSARWTVPNGRARTGQVFVPNGAAAGSTVMIWVNQAGQVTSAPLSPSQVAGRAQLSGWQAVAALVLVLVFVGLAGSWALDRRRMAGWDAEWLATAPQVDHRRKDPASGD
jgi:hypothetical protein